MRGRARGLVLLLALAGNAPDAPAAAPASAAEPRTFRVLMVIHRPGAKADDGFRSYLQTSLRARGHEVDFEVRDLRSVTGEKRDRWLEETVTHIKTSRPDLVYTQSTRVTRAIVGERDKVDPTRHVTDIPVVFAMVSRPVAANLVPQGLVSGRNLTGAIHVVPRSVQLQAMLDYLHDRPLETLGVVYDDRVESQREMYEELSELVAELEERLEQEIRLVGATPRSGDCDRGAEGDPDDRDIVCMVETIDREDPDLLYIPPVSAFAKVSEALTETALEHRLPTFCAIEVQLCEVCLAGLVAPFFEVGELAGRKAELILTGEQPAGEIPVERLSRFSYVVNLRAARELDMYPPMSVLRYATLRREHYDDPCDDPCSQWLAGTACR